MVYSRRYYIGWKGWHEGGSVGNWVRGDGLVTWRLLVLRKKGSWAAYLSTDGKLGWTLIWDFHVWRSGGWGKLVVRWEEGGGAMRRRGVRFNNCLAIGGEVRYGSIIDDMEGDMDAVLCRVG